MKGRILTRDDLSADIALECDVCIVGSGAGGGVLAAGLVERGLSVVMLEAGGHHTRRSFSQHEGEAFVQLYQERGQRVTADAAFTVLQGRNVGGGSTVNWTSCFRTPDRILAHWREHFGVELDAETLRPHFEAIEARLNITEWPREAANANNQTLVRGCEALGWEHGPMRRNVRGCVNSGHCGQGCPVGGKQDMGTTMLADAVQGGMQLFANTAVSHFEVVNDRVVAVHGRVEREGEVVAGGARVTIRPRVAVSSAGALNGPALLLRSGLRSGGLVGRRTFLHPVTATMGEYEQPIEPWRGAPQSAHSHEFIDRGAREVGFFLEVAPGQPTLIATAFRGFGAAHGAFMAKLPHLSMYLALHVDGLVPGDEGGTVSLHPDGRMKLDYPVRSPYPGAFRASAEAMARVHFAAGAKRVYTAHNMPVELRSEADLGLLKRAPWGPFEHLIGTAHQMGGCTMGADPSGSVVDLQLRHRQVPNLFVVDGSVLPTSLGVNPSETIYGLAHWATEGVASAV